MSESEFPIKTLHIKPFIVHQNKCKTHCKIHYLCNSSSSVYRGRGCRLRYLSMSFLFP